MQIAHCVLRHKPSRAVCFSFSLGLSVKFWVLSSSLEGAKDIESVITGSDDVWGGPDRVVYVRELTAIEVVVLWRLRQVSQEFLAEVRIFLVLGEVSDQELASVSGFGCSKATSCICWSATAAKAERAAIRCNSRPLKRRVEHKVNGNIFAIVSTDVSIGEEWLLLIVFMLLWWGVSLHHTLCPLSLEIFQDRLRVEYVSSAVYFVLRDRKACGCLILLGQLYCRCLELVAQGEEIARFALLARSNDFTDLF